MSVSTGAMARSAVEAPVRSAARIDRRSYAPSVLLFLALAAGLLGSAGVITRSHSHDLMFVSDVIWRTAIGQVPHLDYPTPVGIAFVWPYRIVAAFGGGTIADVLSANVLVGAFVLGLCLAVLPRRLSPGLLFLATATILTTAMTGRRVDGGITNYDFLAPYNRWGWAFAILAALLVALPAHGADDGSAESRAKSPANRPGRRSEAVEGIVLGIVLAVLYYLKISIFVAAAGVTAAALTLRFLPIRTAAVALACGALFALGVELVWGTNAAYLGDLARATEVNLTEGRGLFRAGRLLFSLVLTIVFGGLALAVLRLHARRAGPLGTLRLWWREALMLFAVLGAAAAIRVQNHPDFETVMFGAALIAAAEYGRRRSPSLFGSAGDPIASASGKVTADRGLELKRGLLGAVLALGAAFVPAMDAASVAAHAAETNLAWRCRAPVLRGTPLGHLIYPREDLLSAPFSGDRCSDVLRHPFGPERPYENAAQDRRLLRTTGMLRRLTRPGDVVLALDFTNPYPAIFHGPPPRGALTWMDQGRTFSTAVHPDVDMLLGQADLIVQTDYGFDPPPRLTIRLLADFFRFIRPRAANLLGPGQDAWLIYGPAVEARFVPVAQSGEVRIWRRREERRPADRGH